MKTKEKLQLLISYEEKEELKEKHLKRLIKFSKDKDPLVRSSAASLLINFENKAAKRHCLSWPVIRRRWYGVRRMIRCRYFREKMWRSF